MKKIIILIALIANFGFCDVIVKVYNKTTGQVVSVHNKRECTSKLTINTYPYEISIDHTEIISFKNENYKEPKFFTIGCDANSIGFRFAEVYDITLFAYSIERIAQSLK